jgi:hypothetical protein
LNRAIGLLVVRGTSARSWSPSLTRKVVSASSTVTVPPAWTMPTWMRCPATVRVPRELIRRCTRSGSEARAGGGPAGRASRMRASSAVVSGLGRLRSRTPSSTSWSRPRSMRTVTLRPAKRLGGQGVVGCTGRSDAAVWKAGPAWVGCHPSANALRTIAAIVDGRTGTAGLPIQLLG